MATYYVSKQGNDSENGTTPALAWLTIDHAVDTVSAGDTVYVAPGNYIEVVTNGVTGTSGNVITIIGDPGCEKFVDIEGITPGLVRLTQAAAGTELADDSNTILWFFNALTYIVVKNLTLDGIGGSTGTTARGSYGFYNDSYARVGVECYNCTATTSYSAFTSIREVYRCMGISGFYAYYLCYQATDCVAICGYTAMRQVFYPTQCIAIGGYFGIQYPTQAYNCMAIGCYFGYNLANDSDVLDNCVSIACYGGVDGTSGNGAITNHYSTMCRYGYYDIDPTAPNYYSQNYATRHSNVGGDAPVQAPIISYSIKNMMHFLKAFEPWLGKGLEGLADDSDLASQTTDILGRNRRNSSTGSVLLDIGPYEYSTFSGSTHTNEYYLNPPAINIQGRGEVPFQVSVPSGSSMTASVYVKTTDATYPPSLVLRGVSLYDTSITTHTDAGSSWANDTFQQLTVNTAAVVRDEMAELVLSGAILTTSSFSDINIQAKVL